MADTDIGPIFARNLRAALAAGKDGGERALDMIGLEGVNIARTLLSTPGTGRVYRRRGRAHVASSPGQPPAPDYGQLRATMTYVAGSEGGRRFVAIGNPLEKAPPLEFGTRNGRLKARPFMRPMAARLRTLIGPKVRDGWGDAQRRKK